MQASSTFHVDVLILDLGRQKAEDLPRAEQAETACHRGLIEAAGHVGSAARARGRVSQVPKSWSVPVRVRRWLKEAVIGPARVTP